MDVSGDSKDSRLEDKSIPDQVAADSTPRQREITTIKEESLLNETEKMNGSPPIVIELKVANSL